jgi:STE24 endopeptidase
MDFLHRQLGVLQHQLAFVSVEPINWKLYVQTFSWGVTLFESYLLLRQYPLYSRPEPPAVLANHFKGDVFDKSQKYGKDKAKFALLNGLYKQILDSAMLQFGVYAWSWDVAGRCLARFGYGSEYEVSSLYSTPWTSVAWIKVSILTAMSFQISQSIVFSCILVLVSFIPNIPLSVYQTFVLEDKHGFNKTSRGLFVVDLLKSWALGLAIGAPFLAAFLWVFKWAGDRFVPWLMGFLCVSPQSADYFTLFMGMVLLGLRSRCSWSLPTLPSSSLSSTSSLLWPRANYALELRRWHPNLSFH